MSVQENNQIEMFDAKTVSTIMSAYDAMAIEETGLSQAKFYQVANEDCDPKDKNTSRKDIYTAKAAMFIVQSGFNVRDNGFKNGVDPKKARRYADLYKKGKKLPPLLVVRVIIKGKAYLKIIDGHNRYAGALIAQKETGKEFILPYVESTAKNEAEMVAEMLDCGDALALTLIDKGNGYKRLVNCGWEESRIAQYFNVTVKEVKDGLRISDLPENIKQAIREDQIAWTRVFKLYDSYLTRDEAESAIELEIEGNQKANKEALERGDKKARKRHNNEFRKKTVGKALVGSMAGTINEVSNHIAQELGFDSIDSLPKDKEHVQVSLPVELLQKLLGQSDEITALEEHNSKVEQAIAQRKAEKKAASQEQARA